VSAAWDFEGINKRYSDYLEVLEQLPRQALSTSAAAQRLQHWGVTEHQAWLNAVVYDPLLPQGLLPQDYQGCRAWRRRVQVLREASQLLRSFKL
jgi:DNA-binding transcriptional regulator PaaX